MCFVADENVTHAFIMFHDGNQRILGDKSNETFATAGNDQIDCLVLFQKDVHGLAIN